MHWRDWLGIAAGSLGALSIVFYLIAILRGRTRPNRVTWLVFTALGFVMLASYRASGAGTTIWVAVASAVGCLTVFVFSIWRGEKGWTGIDAVCLLAAAGCFVLLLAAESPTIALVAALIADLVGLWPTVVKAYRRPWTESPSAWIVGSVTNALNLAAVDDWRFSILVYPAYMLATCLLVAALTLRRMPRPEAA